MSPRDLSDLSMLDLFRMEAEGQTQALTSGLLALERHPERAEHLEACMRAAHSLKGAARLVDIGSGVTLAHALEDFFVAAQTGRVALTQDKIDLLLEGVDLLIALTKTPDAEIGADTGARRPEITRFVARLSEALAAAAAEPAAPPPALARTEPNPAPAPEASLPLATPSTPPETAASASERLASPTSDGDPSDRMFRVSVDNLNRLLGLAGESLVDSRRLQPFSQSLLQLKTLQLSCGRTLDALRDALPRDDRGDLARDLLAEAQSKMLAGQQVLLEQLAELDVADRRATNLTRRLYDAVLSCRMRPFSDGLQSFPRLVRDLGRTLDKSVRLEIQGGATEVDRDILEQLEAPLGHLLRNAIDHGLESPAERRTAGKPLEGVVTLEARHSGGSLHIAVTDDGRGIDLDRLRGTVVERGLTDADTAAKLSGTELLEFLFLPGFTLKEKVTEISGRGVGLDVVQTMVKRVRGIVRLSSQFGKGTRFQLQLPLTLSVVRALVVEIAGEPYAIPLASIARAVKVSAERIETLEGRQHVLLEGRHVGLVSAHQIFADGPPKLLADEVPVVLIGDQLSVFGLVVDRFIGRYELVLQSLDARLGKIKDIGAAALMEDGTPVLIVDVDDLLRSMEKLAASNRLSSIRKDSAETADKARKRVLVVDDSLTVRELERKLLDRHGYEVEVAVDGMDGWNALRAGRFDLVVTDVDMPRLDGIELVKMIRRDPALKGLPTLIVSYKDREEDRQRGLDAGADYYLTKSSFHDDGLIRAVTDLIGGALS